MVQLARHYDGQTLTRLDDLAQREAVSANFLVQILNDLKRGNLIISKRGKTGGYLLARDPSEISLLHVTQAVEPGMLTANSSRRVRSIDQSGLGPGESIVSQGVERPYHGYAVYAVAYVLYIGCQFGVFSIQSLYADSAGTHHPYPMATRCSGTAQGTQPERLPYQSAPCLRQRLWPRLTAQRFSIW